VGDEPKQRLSRDKVLALKFAAHRQLARWSNRRELSPHQHAQRTALTRAVRILEDKALPMAASCMSATQASNDALVAYDEAQLVRNGQRRGDPPL
jgi:hypothetical protein